MEGNATRVLCPECEKEMNCKIEKEYINKRSFPVNDEFSIDARDTLAVLICQGCGAGFFRKNSWHSEAYDEITTDIFPSIHPGAHSLKFQSYEIVEFSLNSGADMFLYGLYQEISSAINAGLAKLAAMGIRTLVDGLCIKLVGEQPGGISANLKKTFEEKHISQSEFELFSRVLEIGNSSAHRMFSPTLDDVCLCLEAAERLMHQVYIAPKNLQKLKAVQTPPNTRAKKAP